jgi:hypothetical protein
MSMADREISTRDLAQASEKGAEEPEGRKAPDRPAGDHAEETAPADEPLARERSELGEPMDTARDRSGDERPTEASTVDEKGPLLPDDETDRFTSRWREIQIAFVDEPRDSVAEADALVAELMQRLAASFSDERRGLEQQWDRGDGVSTEDLRVALTRYRSFFDRLLSA